MKKSKKEERNFSTKLNTRLSTPTRIKNPKKIVTNIFVILNYSPSFCLFCDVCLSSRWVNKPTMKIREGKGNLKTHEQNDRTRFRFFLHFYCHPWLMLIVPLCCCWRFRCRLEWLRKSHQRTEKQKKIQSNSTLLLLWVLSLAYHQPNIKWWKRKKNLKSSNL